MDFKCLLNTTQNYLRTWRLGNSVKIKYCFYNYAFGCYFFILNPKSFLCRFREKEIIVQTVKHLICSFGNNIRHYSLLTYILYSATTVPNNLFGFSLIVFYLIGLRCDENVDLKQWFPNFIGRETIKYFSISRNSEYFLNNDFPKFNI